MSNIEGRLIEVLEQLAITTQQTLADSTASPALLEKLIKARATLSGPIKMALAGEFSSGKTTLARMLLGQDFVTTKASASAMPTVRFEYAEQTTFTLISSDIEREIGGLDALSEDEMRAADALIITVDLPFLKRVQLFDTPGTSDPTRDVDQIVAIANDVDFIMWCTNATQAWRQSERAMWGELPEEAQEKSLLIVTHVDLPKVKASLPRLMKRMNKEAGPHFRKILPVDLLSAIKARLDAKLVNDSISWIESGGEACIAAINDVVDQVRAGQIAEVEELLNSTGIAEPSAIVQPPKQVELETFATLWTSSLAKATSTGGTSEVYLEFLRDFKEGRIGNWTETDAIKVEIQERLHEAVTFLSAATDANMSKDVVMQLDWEFKNLVGIEAA